MWRIIIWNVQFKLTIHNCCTPDYFYSFLRKEQLWTFWNISASQKVDTVGGGQVVEKFASSAMSRAGFAAFLPSDQFCSGSAGFDWRSRRQMKWFQFSAKFYSSTIGFISLIATTTPHSSEASSKDEFGSFDQSQLKPGPVLTRPSQERICSFFGEKKPRLFFLTHILRNNNPQDTMPIFHLDL